MSEAAGELQPRAEQTSDHEVVVIGAGQAGLTMGYYLAQQRRQFVVLERSGSVAPAWRERWDSLTLFTPRRYSALPGLPFPGDPDGYPTRDDVIEYLERYAETFELPIELNSKVRRLSHKGGRFVLEVDGRTITADQVVVATGPFQTPFVPKVAEHLDPDVWQEHSTGYRRPSDVPEGTVLVVGGGNTGFQIAKELSSTHKVSLSVGTRQKPLPQRVAGRDLFWWLTKTGLIHKTVDSRLGKRLKERDTLIGSSPRKLKRHYDVELKPRAIAAAGRTVSFEDKSEIEVDAVIWATGYRPDYSWIELPILDSDGRLRHGRGVTDVPGLCFLGLTWQHTRGSALIGWVQDDAEFIARQIAAHPAGRDGRASGPPVETDQFSRETTGLPMSHPPETVELGDGDRFDLEIAPVAKRLGDATVRMLAYNRSIPGPTLKVRQDSEVLVNVTNHGDLEATVHWHGVRVENRYDGTHQTQAPIAVGESFTYRVQFPDPGVYWYHPHVREDYGQELGLYGNIIVVPTEPEYWPQANRELPLTLDDVLLDEEGKVAPFSHHETTYVAMGRFGDVLLIGGEDDLALRARLGEVKRFFFTNTANTRVFKVGLPGARMKLVGGDSGRHEHEEFVDDVILAPSERVVVDVLFEEAGELTLEHRTPERTYALARITVDEEPAEPSFAEEFEVLRSDLELMAERERIAPYLEAKPDKILALVAEMDLSDSEAETGAVFACPMHPEIIASWAGKCPKCGMKLLPAQPGIEAPTAYVCPMHPEVTATWAETCPECGMTLRATGVGEAAEGVGDAMTHDDVGHDHRHGEGHERHEGSHQHGASEGIEWEDDMVDVNRMTTPANMRWLLVDRATGAENAAIDWQFQVGDRVKIRVVNEMDSDHPMHHPIHIHGAGRFLILSRDDVVEPNLVWKDTVLVRTGETVDILLDVTNPGVWMVHCHIAEHHESGMMFSFNVAAEAT